MRRAWLYGDTTVVDSSSGEFSGMLYSGIKRAYRGEAALPGLTGPLIIMRNHSDHYQDQSLLFRVICFNAFYHIFRTG